MCEWQLGHSDGDEFPDKLVPTVMESTQVMGATFATVSCGAQSTAAVGDDGVLWMWGSGSQGVLGLGDEAEHKVCKSVLKSRLFFYNL